MEHIISTVDALQSLTPGAQWVMRGDVLEWLDEVQTEPTALELSTEVTRLQTEFDGLEYSRLREVEYNKLNQDEMRFDDQLNGTTIWVDAILAIKVAIPKPV